MDPREYVPPVDREFTAQCSRRFPRAHNALNALRRLGQPPLVITTDDHSWPPPEFQTAIQAMGALGSSKETSIVRAGWGALISPWVKVFLEEVVLRLQWLRHRGRHWDARLLKQTTPYIEPLLVRIWFKVLDECHLESDEGGITQESANLSQDIVYVLDERTGLMFAHHINFHLPKIRRISNDELLAMNAFMALLAGHEGQGSFNPLKFPAVVLQLVPALVNFVSGMMFKRKIDPTGSPNRIPPHIHPLVTLPLRNLHTVLLDPLSTVIALDSGILKVLLKPYPCFFRHDDTPRFQPEEVKLVYWTSSILQRIARFTVYPNVLHAFLVASRKVDVEGLDAELQAKSPPTSKCWNELKDKATVLREIRNGLWEDGFVTCGNTDGTRDETSPKGSASPSPVFRMFVDYILLVAMSEVILEETQEVLPRRVTKHMRYRFFESLIANFLALYTQPIQRAVDRYKLQLVEVESLSEDQQLIKAGIKNPIIYLNFDTSVTPMPDHETLQIARP
ncbi:hypothetical protein AAF712_012223 [Marasmius tenuissimus]|uniref:Uncharacterized protein n=1 Tax=Marasmius tenuissimus TaxID=585030 RepID=A0ABR2ZJ24_9AGAR